MNIKVPKPNKAYDRTVKAVLFRHSLICLLILAEEFGFGQVRRDRFEKAYSKRYTQYVEYDASCGMSDEKLIRDCEAAGVKIEDWAKEEMRKAEEQAFLAGLNAKDPAVRWGRNG